MNATQQQAVMQKMMKLGAPGKHHQVLDMFVGKWNYTVESRMIPQAKPQIMKGTSENKWILGNRFIQEEVTGGEAAQPFQGIGLLGYDNIRQEYTSVWLDNMGTGMMEASAVYDPSTKTFAEKGTVSCPLTGEKHRKYRAIWKITDDNHYTYEMYMEANGKEFKSLEINYERAE